MQEDIHLYHSTELYTFSTLSGQGEGWGPAVLNTQAEVDLIKQKQMEFYFDRSYWVGGSTSASPGNIIDLSEYNTGNSSNSNIFWIVFYNLWKLKCVNYDYN